ncbi:hypothetical protein SAMN02745866_01354 [Alteromonadaceae bacterium Bs31]|nr:hypothetical protein SAMN02745866_01354 [Alteromonadaceae bacterium Bs31]
MTNLMIVLSGKRGAFFPAFLPVNNVVRAHIKALDDSEQSAGQIFQNVSSS